MTAKDDELPAKEEKQQLERRTFLKQAAAAAIAVGAGASTTGMAEGFDGNDDIKISTPLKSRKVIKCDLKTDGNKQECALEIEFVDSSNFKLHTSNYMTRIDEGDRYDITIMRAKTLFRSPEDTIPLKSATSTMLMSGKKGPVVGEYRTDEVVITVIRNGQVITRDPMEMKVLVTDKFKGMSSSELANLALDMRFGKEQGEK
jgi:hypothetical protein